jgi:hypothetical protein
MTEGKNKLHRRDGSRIPLSTRFPHVIYHLLYTDVDLFWEDGTRASVSEIKNHPPLRSCSGSQRTGHSPNPRPPGVVYRDNHDKCDLPISLFPKSKVCLSTTGRTVLYSE